MKMILAIVLISILVCIASADMAPDVPFSTVLIICAIAAVILLIVLIFAIIIGGSVNQVIIRNGGTDPAWFWFEGEPPGLERQRTELRNQKE
jgi:hypothetical protein